uniref:EF-hand domain-containing protein n=1 Tax=Branchiostoma floridae TaxID=7739 RepID=C3XQM3_BRAFL|eukprot:XP_002613590.1 hypothetical protein BRAFLDRAFT_93634 [Branchiostoma floridae]
MAVLGSPVRVTLLLVLIFCLTIHSTNNCCTTTSEQAQTEPCNRFCNNGGTPFGSRCICTPHFTGLCCDIANSEGCPTVVIYGSTTVQVSMMTSYTMTGDIHEGRPVYYSSATCYFLYYMGDRNQQWWVGQQVGNDVGFVYVRDNHLFAEEIIGTFLLWDGRQWIEDSIVQIACSDDVPAGVVVSQPESGTTDCPRVRLQGDATYQPSRMTTYTRTTQTSGGRPVYISDRDSRDFLFYVDDHKQWVVGPTIGQHLGRAYVNDCAMTPDQTRPVWHLLDGSRQWQFVPSVHATCIGSDGSGGSGATIINNYTSVNVKAMIRERQLHADVKMDLDTFPRVVKALEEIKKALYNPQETHEAMVATFNYIDKNGDGFLSTDELKAGMASVVGMELSSEAIAELIRLADYNMDGQIDIAEFVKMVTSFF